MKFAIISSGGDSSKMLAKEAKAYFKSVDRLDIKHMQMLVSDETKVLYEGKPIKDYDCIYIRGSYKYTLLQRTLTEALKDKAYIPNAPDAFTLAHNKFLTAVALQKHKVPIPTTYLTRSVEGARKVLEQVSYPIIMKIPSGTQGKGVIFADSLESAKSILDTMEAFKSPYIIQEYIETGAKDIRAIVAGNEVIACMQRTGAERDVRANIHAGGKGSPIQLDEKTIDVAIRAAKSINASVCGVDILQSNKGPVVIEVNMSPGLKGITEALKNVNVAKKIVEYLFNQTKEFREKKSGQDFGSVMKELKVKPAGAPEAQELINLDIKADRIKLPKEAMTLSGLKHGEEVILVIRKGKVIIKKMDIAPENIKKP